MFWLLLFLFRLSVEQKISIAISQAEAQKDAEHGIAMDDLRRQTQQLVDKAVAEKEEFQAMYSKVQDNVASPIVLPVV